MAGVIISHFFIMKRLGLYIFFSLTVLALSAQHDTLKKEYNSLETRSLIEVGDNLELFYGNTDFNSNWIEVMETHFLTYDRDRATYRLFDRSSRVLVDSIVLANVSKIKRRESTIADIDPYYHNTFSRTQKNVSYSNDSTISLGIVKIKRDYFRHQIVIRDNRISNKFTPYNHTDYFSQWDIPKVVYTSQESFFGYRMSHQLGEMEFALYTVAPFIYYGKALISKNEKARIESIHPVSGGNDYPCVYQFNPTSKSIQLDVKFAPYDWSAGSTSVYKLNGGSPSLFKLSDSQLVVFNPGQGQGKLISNLKQQAFDLPDLPTNYHFNTIDQSQVDKNTFWILGREKASSEQQRRIIVKIRIDTINGKAETTAKWILQCSEDLSIADIHNGDLFISAKPKIGEGLYVYRLPYNHYEKVDTFSIHSSGIEFVKYYERENRNQLKSTAELPEEVLQNLPYSAHLLANQELLTDKNSAYSQKSIGSLISSIGKCLESDNYIYILEHLMCYHEKAFELVEEKGIQQFAKQIKIDTRFNNAVDALYINRPFNTQTQLDKYTYSIQVQNTYEFYAVKIKGKYYLSTFFWSP